MDEPSVERERVVRRFFEVPAQHARRVNVAVRPLNRIAEDGDVPLGNPRDSIPALARCVLGRNDVHS